MDKSYWSRGREQAGGTLTLQPNTVLMGQIIKQRSNIIRFDFLEGCTGKSRWHVSQGVKKFLVIVKSKAASMISNMLIFEITNK